MQTQGIQVTRLPTSASESTAQDDAHSTLHIYPHKDRHTHIKPTKDLSKESSWGKAARKARKEHKENGNVLEVSESADGEGAFFLHSPYLAFHDPPKVLYMGADRNATPIMLIHGGAFWRKYKLQLGSSIGTPGVIDPRGVVCWKHNGGDKHDLKADDKKLKGYKVRTWRLWGETGKAYVHGTKANRKAGIRPDPDVLDDLGYGEDGEIIEPARAEEVVYLKWERPFSRHTRRYHFQYAGVDFYWKGTGTVKKSGSCGFFVRFNHLKLVAKIPVAAASKKDRPEVCLAKYTCSLSGGKCGKLDIFDTALLRLAEEYVQPIGEIGIEQEEAVKIARLKKTLLYQIVIATGLCMVSAEKEKRKAVWEWLQEAGEGAGG